MNIPAVRTSDYYRFSINICSAADCAAGSEKLEVFVFCHFTILGVGLPFADANYQMFYCCTFALNSISVLKQPLNTIQPTISCIRARWQRA